MPLSNLEPLKNRLGFKEKGKMSTGTRDAPSIENEPIDILEIAYIRSISDSARSALAEHVIP